MSKLKSKDIRNISGKKCGKNNNIPKEICSIVKRLERLDFVKHIELGNFRNSNNSSGIRVIGYDEKSRNYHINANTGRYEQKILLNVFDKKPEYEPLIKRCF
jgi:hypothetical protein